MIKKTRLKKSIAFGLGCLTPTLIGACSLAPAIEHNSIDYNSTIEQVSNISLVVNVLRARDEAPLYFPDLSQIRGSITLSTGAQATIPFGPRFGSTTRRSLQDGPITVSSNPSFDIAPSNTKQFYQGILNPISKDLLSYFIERYVGSGKSRYVFYLLVDSVEEQSDGGIQHIYTWRSPDYERIFDTWFSDRGGSRGPRVVALSQSSVPLGPPVKADADSIIKADAAGLKIGPAGDGKIQLSKQATGAVICMPNGSGYEAVGISKNSIVKPAAGEEITSASNSQRETTACNNLGHSAKHTSKTRYNLRLRSVEQVFLFLGALIDPRGNYGRRTKAPDIGCPYIPFRVSRDPGNYARFSVPYQGEIYYVSGTDAEDECGRVDNTLVILSIVNDLLNLNRDANEIPTTKATQAVNQ